MSKALSVQQPWALLEVLGIKDIENRTWKTKHRGRLYIHVTGHKGKKFKASLTNDQMRAAIGVLTDTFNKDEYTFSAIIGYVDLVDIVENHSSIWAIKGYYHWILANPVMFDTPILDVKGKLSLWDCSEYIDRKEATNETKK